MTVLEISDLVKAMEEKFGVTAAAPVAVAAAPAAGAAAAPVEEQTEFTVVLKGNVPADKKSLLLRKSVQSPASALKKRKISLKPAISPSRRMFPKRKQRKSRSRSKPPAVPSRSNNRSVFDVLAERDRWLWCPMVLGCGVVPPFSGCIRRDLNRVHPDDGKF